MKMNSMILSAVVAIAALASSPVSQVQAANITIKRGTCQALQLVPNPVPAPPLFSSGSIGSPRTSDGGPTGDRKYSAGCGVPRQPLANGALAGSFWVAGTSFPGHSTTCSSASFHVAGPVLGLVV